VPPLVIVALGALGAAALAKVVASKVGGAAGEAWRQKQRMARQRTGEAGDMTTIPLVRDPVTGEYRPRQH